MLINRKLVWEPSTQIKSTLHKWGHYWKQECKSIISKLKIKTFMFYSIKIVWETNYGYSDNLTFADLNPENKLFISQEK